MLDLKYRPILFSQVLGNEGVIKLLLNRSQNRTLTQQSMLLSGPKGCGKTSIARIVSRSIFCQSLKNGEPCNSCSSCSDILNEVSPHVIELDAASHGTVDKVRSMVQEANYEHLDGSDLTVYIIDEAQRLSKSAQDAFLKAIEDRLFISIFCTTEPHKIQGPIRDRLEEYPVRIPDERLLLQRLQYINDQENLKFSEEILKLAMLINANTPRSSIISLSTLQILGVSSLEEAKHHFGIYSYELIDKILYYLDSDTSKSLLWLDELLDRESPIWIKEQIIKAITCSYRSSLGIRFKYPTSLHFFEIRKSNWLDLALKLSSVERPVAADLESILLSNKIEISTSISVPDTKIVKLDSELPESLTITKKEDLNPIKPKEINQTADLNLESESKSKSEPIKEPEKTEPGKIKAKSVEIDGVIFTADEVLTSLDNKIKSESLVKTEPDLMLVKLDKSRVPITNKEFASSFLGRLK